MRLEELMVGDLVYSSFSDIPCKVQYLELRESGYGSVKTSNVDGIKDIASLYPIPLTPEILEKNNFLKMIWHGRRGIAITTYAIGEGFNLEEDNDGFNLVDNCSDSGDYGYESNYICDIKYIHELQHALRLLKIEKTIEL